MADKRIQDLTPASSVQTTDLFVLEQSGAAKSLTGQILINDLATALNGHGGISNISYAAPVAPSLAGTLTITTADGTSYTLSVTNGRGITGITWVDSGTPGDGATHTGTIAYNDGTSSTVTFKDGVKGDQGVQTYVWIRWAQDYPTQDSDVQNSVAPYIGIYTGTASTAPTAYTAYTWYQYKGDKGDTGDSLESIELTSTSGLVDTYTVYLTGHVAASTFTVTNAKSIVSITMISGSHAAGTTDVYEILFNDGDTASFSVYNGANGLGSVSTVSGIQADGNGDVPQVISGNGAPTTATVGQEKQLYYDLTNSVLYYCAGESQGTYVWLGAGVTVDSSLSNSSTNPVQNAVITTRIGTGALPNSNTELTAAINYVDGRIPSASTTTPQKDGTGAAGTGTTWARSNHVHPLNVASSGVPADLGTAALGSATSYARTDHVHKLPTPSDIGTVKYYTSVADLGLTVGSATIADAFAAMAANSMLSCNAGDFDATEVPSVYGMIEILCPSQYHDRATINYRAKASNTVTENNAYMFLDPATAVPDGIWWTVPAPSSSTPQPLGTANAGTSLDYARADHVHAQPTKTLFSTATAQTIATTSNGSFIGNSDLRIAYNAFSVEFNCRYTLSGVTSGNRPTITITDPIFAACPSFVARGNPVLRGSAGSPVESDECYATHDYGQNTITLLANNFIGATPAGYAVYQIPGVAMV